MARFVKSIFYIYGRKIRLDAEFGIGQSIRIFAHCFTLPTDATSHAHGLVPGSSLRKSAVGLA
jgi:hypothetical protein